MIKVLVIRCGALGDLIYATSIIDALKFEYGEDTVIDFVATPASAALFRKDPRVRHVFPLKHKKIAIFLSKEKRAIVQASKKEPYDILVNLEFGKQFQPLAQAIYADKKIDPLEQNSTLSNSVQHSVDIIKHLYKNIVSKEVLERSFPRLIGTDAKEVQKLYDLPEKYLIISPSNSHQKKNRLNYRAWENHKWQELIARLHKKIPIVIIGGKGEEKFFEKLLPYPEGVIDLVGKTSLPDLVGVIGGARALVATDTGTAHMASATQTEVFALIGPTPASVTGPYQGPSNTVHIISAHLACSPCYKTSVMQNCTDNLCMKQISVETVAEAIETSLKKDLHA